MHIIFLYNLYIYENIKNWKKKYIIKNMNTLISTTIVAW